MTGATTPWIGFHMSSVGWGSIVCGRVALRAAREELTTSELLFALTDVSGAGACPCRDDDLVLDRIELDIRYSQLF